MIYPTEIPNDLQIARKAKLRPTPDIAAALLAEASASARSAAEGSR